MAKPETLPLRLSPKERNLVTRHIDLPAKLRNKLNEGREEDDMLVFDLTVEELDALADALEDEEDLADRPELEDVLERVSGLLDLADWGEEDEASLEDLPEPLRRALEEIVEDPTVTSWEQVAERLRPVADRMGEELRPQLGGLTPMQVYLLLDSHWYGEDSVVQLNESLPPEAFQDNILLTNARILLQVLREEGPVKTTEAGNLPRKFVEMIVQRLVLPEGFLEEERTVSKVLNEKDIGPLHMVRVLLEGAKLTAVANGRMRIMREGLGMLADDRAGALFARLFRSLYFGVNTDYFDALPEVPGLKESVAFSLYKTQQLANDWQRTKTLAPQIFLPYVLQEMPPIYTDCPDSVTYYAEARVFWHLARFGLLERRSVPDPAALLKRADEVRKTPLFDQFIDFRLPDV